MPEKNHLQPDTLFDASHFGYTQLVTSEPGTLVFCSGQVALDQGGELVGDTIAVQTEQALKNVGLALAAAGATPADLTHLRFYIPNYEPKYAQELGPVLNAFLDGTKPPAQTMIGVQALAIPGLLIEIEATAVI